MATTESPVEHFSATARHLLVDRRDAVIKTIIDMLHKELPELVGDRRIAELLEASVTENIVSAINYLSGGDEFGDLEASTAAIAHARVLAQRDIPVSALFRAYRLGHARFIDEALELVRLEEPGLQVEFIKYLFDRSASFVDTVCEQIGRVYEAERDHWVGNRGGMRQHWLAEVLSGRPLDAGEAQRAVGYDFGGTHVGVQMWVTPEVANVEARAVFEDTRRLLSSALATVGQPLVTMRDEREMHAWFPVRGSVLPETVITREMGKNASRHVHVAIGRPEVGIDGFRLTIGQAQRVKEILMLSTHPLPRSATFDELGPTALMAADIDQLRHFVVRVLGDLAAHGSREETLRETLHSFLANNRSYSATAEAMTLHRNSVQYRVNRAVTMCGSDLNSPGAALELQSALNAARWLGDAVLS